MVQRVSTLLIVGCVLFYLCADFAHAQSADDGFNPGANGLVRALLVERGGMIYVGGAFAELDGAERPRLGRFYPDGSLDDVFTPNIPNGSVDVIARHSDGAVLIGGTFTLIDGQSRGRIARLDADGALDETFNPDANNTVFAIAVQPDDMTLIGGEFTTMGDQPQSYLARVDEDGALDEDFEPDINGVVQAVAVQPDGKILIGGTFTEVNGVARSRLARLLPDGSLDLGFISDVTGSQGPIASFALQADGKIIVGGYFFNIGGVSQRHVARLYPDGTMDADFNPDLGGDGYEPFLRSVWVQPDGRIVIAGHFESVDEVPIKSLARLLPDGSLDETFAPSPNHVVWALAQQPDGKLVFGGNFWLVDGVARLNLARVYPCGALDATLDPGSVEELEQRRVVAIAHQPDGGILAGGLIESWDGEARMNLVRLRPDGALDNDFAADVAGDVYALAVQRDNKILVGGFFTNVSGYARRNLARLNPDGSVDVDFDPGAYGGIPDTLWMDEGVTSFLLMPDGKILVGGHFTNLAGYARTGLGLLNNDGTLDTDFTANTDDVVLSLVRMGDDHILAGGYFEMIGGQNRPYLAKLCSISGMVDATFDPDINNSVRCVTVRRDGRVLIGGDFTEVDGVSRERLALFNNDGSLNASFTPSVDHSVRTIALRADDRILIGGDFSEINEEPKHLLARLTVTGELDPSFAAEPDADGVHVNALAIQPDGKVLVGGWFDELAGESRIGFGRLSTTEGSYQNLRVDETFSDITWDHRRLVMSTEGPFPIFVPRGSGPETHYVEFEISYDGTNWSWLGRGERTLSGWTLTNQVLTKQTNLYIRGRAEYGTGTGGGSVSAWESVRQIFVEPLSEWGILNMEKGPPVAIFYGPTAVGQTYWLQYAVDLVDGVWSNVPGAAPQEGSGDERWVEDANVPAEQRIYRIKAE